VAIALQHEHMKVFKEFLYDIWRNIWNNTVSKVVFCFLVFGFSLGTFGELYANVNETCFSLQ
jgi:predicted Zn-dependent protease